jgi:hypothetical protein
MVADARVVTTYQTGTDPDGVDIPIIDGDVSADAAADVRATLALTTDGTNMFTTQSSGLLTPYGNEIFVRRGISYGNGTSEWVSQGYFRIATVEESDLPNNPLRIAALDRMSGIVEARLIEPIQFFAAELVGDVVLQLVSEVYPLVTIEWDDTTDVMQLGRDQVAERDRFEFLTELVTSFGKIMYFDYRGVLVIRDPPDPTVSVYSVNSGHNGVLVSLDQSITREGTYNAVVVNGEAGDTLPPVHAVVLDNNPNSPTYWYGRFGKVPRFFASSFITTNDQAVRAGTSLLQQVIGLPYNIDFTTVPNPALEVADAVEVTTSSGIEIHVIETLVTPLRAEGIMSAKTREQFVVSS